MRMIRPEDVFETEEQRPSLFLAGPIQGSPRWDEILAERLEDLDADVFNPRRLEMEGFDYAQQVDWETEHLKSADVISFTFANPVYDVEGRSYAQTSRFEIGEYLARAKYGNTGQKIVVFLDVDFPGSRYILRKVTKEYRDLAVACFDWEEYIARIRDFLGTDG